MKVPYLMFHGTKTRQTGFALFTALIFLVALTLLGIGVFSTTISEEKMARNFRDKEIALIAAEAALNEAKILITASYNSGTPPTTVPTPLSEDKCYSGTPTGYSCDPTINANTLDLFSGSVTGAAVGGGGVIASVSPAIVGVSSAPRYLVVWQKSSVCGISNTSYCYQIIAQAKGRLTNTRVNLIELFTY
ncbi:MAG: PilX N-terminal domain-containing pilus assembly protein [Azonexus sp.]|nr:PilX N-terminal domain-containing pilus assembly protein [Azonexus sp.]